MSYFRYQVIYNKFASLLEAICLNPNRCENIKMKRIIIACCMNLILFSCSSDDGMQEIPECLKPTITAILEKPVQSPKAKIELWKYEEKEVYVIDAQNFPDGQTFVITTDCEETICTLGGIDGSDNDCPLWNNATLIKILWIDPR